MTLEIANRLPSSNARKVLVLLTLKASNRYLRVKSCAMDYGERMGERER